MINREKLWQHFEQTGNPMSYIAYRQQSKSDDRMPRAFTHSPTLPSHEDD
ncbi:MAG: hypothetical protein FWC71_05240 [Defluviitaleaceae bacterium]|nr:hypothetical protein [Defluviitaleaceae bacterium]